MKVWAFSWAGLPWCNNLFKTAKKLTIPTTTRPFYTTTIAFYINSLVIYRYKKPWIDEEKHTAISAISHKLVQKLTRPCTTNTQTITTLSTNFYLKVSFQVKVRIFNESILPTLTEKLTSKNSLVQLRQSQSSVQLLLTTPIALLPNEQEVRKGWGDPRILIASIRVENHFNASTMNSPSQLLQTATPSQLHPLTSTPELSFRRMFGDFQQLVAMDKATLSKILIETHHTNKNKPHFWCNYSFQRE